MATPQPERSGLITPVSSKGLALTPGSRVLQTPLGDETIWKRLQEVGFDEESIRRRDKAALIAYIAKLEAEIFDHQHHMGLLILERKEFSSQYEQIKTSAEIAAIQYKRDQAAHSSALAEAKKREDNLKKTVGVKEECIASMEKALHEMRVETAETKVAAEGKLTEARCMMEDAQKKFTESEAKLHAAESLQAEANRYQRSAERKLKEVEAREDDLRRRMISFKSDCDKKEAEMTLERQSLSDRQKVLQQQHEKLTVAQASLNQREDYIFSRSQELSRLEKELEDSRANIAEERNALNDEKSKLELNEASLSSREEAVTKREALLIRKEQELLTLQEKIATKESAEIEKVVASHESALRTRKLDFDAELQIQRKLVEDEIEAKRRAWELREMDLRQREELVLEKEHDLEVQSRSLANKEKDVIELSNCLDEKEKTLRTAEQDLELNKVLLQKEKEEYSGMKQELQRSLDLLENNKKQVDCAKEKLEAMKSENNELSNLEIRLKEEIDSVRDQKVEIMEEADKLKIEKAKFEAEWELIDEKREELQKEVERLAAERLALSKFIKDERDSLSIEREAMRDQFKRDAESLCHEKEEFMNMMACERSEWLNKMQQERADLLLDVETQKKELENCLEQRREVLESGLRERMKRFEQEKKNDLEYISSLKEKVEKDLEQVALKMKRLETERMEIILDREKRNRDWAELKDSIEELKVQREKLEKQRELLHADREEILSQIGDLKKFEDLKVALDNATVAGMEQSDLEPSRVRSPLKRYLKQQSHVCNNENDTYMQIDPTNISNGLDSPSMQKLDRDCPPSSSRFSWIKRCSELIFKNSPERPSAKYQDKPLIFESDGTSLRTTTQFGQSINYDKEKHREDEKSLNTVEGRREMKKSVGKPKVIVEVPPSVEAMKGILSLESENRDTGASKHLAGKKRRVSNSASDVSVEPPEQNHNNKKQRKREASNTSEYDLTCCDEGSRPNVPEDEHASMPSSQTQKDAEETGIVIVDKIIKITEVTCERTDIDNSAIQEKSNHHQDALVKSVQDILWSEEVMDSHLPSLPIIHGVLPSNIEAQQIIHDVHLVNVGQPPDRCETGGEDM